MVFSERNSGCRYKEMIFCGLQMIVMENDKMRLCILTEKGGEIIEVLYKPFDIDFAWHAPLGYQRLSYIKNVQKGDQYLTDVYSGGWFECFPNIGAACESSGAQIPLHGEVYGLPWTHKVIADTEQELCIEFSVACVKTPFLLKKTITLKNGSAKIFFDINITNIGRQAMPFQLGFHPNVGTPFLSENCVLDMPNADVKALYQSPKSRAKDGGAGKWPFIQGVDGKLADMSIVPKQYDDCKDILIMENMSKGFGAIRNTDKKLAIGFSWDERFFKNCLLWLVMNGDEGYPRYGNTYVACILPMNSGGGNLENESDALDKLEAGNTFSTYYTVSIFEADRKIVDIDRDGDFVLE